MIEQLVSFETAKLAREKKFDLETIHFYSSRRGYYEGLNETKYTLAKNQGFAEGEGIYAIRKVNWNGEDFDDIEYWSAPTQSLLQKWLREVHKINIMCMWQNGYFLSYCSVNKQEERITGQLVKSHLRRKREKHSTYEECLELGLQVALRAIQDESE